MGTRHQNNNCSCVLISSTKLLYISSVNMETLPNFSSVLFSSEYGITATNFEKSILCKILFVYGRLESRNAIAFKKL